MVEADESPDSTVMLEQQRFLTIAEAAAFLHVSEISLRRWTNSGKLRCFRVGGRRERRFLIDDLLAFMPEADSQAEVSKQPLAQNLLLPKSEAEARHICLFFHNADEQWHLLRPYIATSLQAHMPVLYVQESATLSHIFDHLLAEGVLLEEVIAPGLLRVLPAAQAYLLGGSFDAQRMLSFVEAAIQETLSAGYTGILITGEMAWSLSGTKGVEQLKTYEALLNAVVDKYPTVTIVCQYDLLRSNGQGVLDALLTHTCIHIQEGRAPGFYGLEKADIPSISSSALHNDEP